MTLRYNFNADIFKDLLTAGAANVWIFEKKSSYVITYSILLPDIFVTIFKKYLDTV